MRRYLNLTVVIFLVSVLSVAKQNPVAEKPAANAAGKAAVSAPATNLPSEQTVDGFMQQTFGYDPQVSWKIASIRPAPVPGLVEVLVTLASPQGQQISRFYVTADGEHAVVGDIIPFGATPFAPARKLLDKGITGPGRGPKDAPVTIVEFGDLQCPACKAAQPAIEGLVKAEPNARFVFQNYPLEMHNWAATMSNKPTSRRRTRTRNLRPSPKLPGRKAPTLPRAPLCLRPKRGWTRRLRWARRWM